MTIFSKAKIFLEKIEYLRIRLVLKILRESKKTFLSKQQQIIKDKFDNSQTEPSLNKSEIRKQKIIVSLTSFPPRYEGLHKCLLSLLKQTVRPDKIIVWLYKEEFSLTNEMKELEKCGIEYKSVDENLKPHKKYFYAMKEFPDDLIITVDDDVIYPENCIETLITTHKKFPDSVCANRVNKITKKINGDIFEYKYWINNFNKSVKPSHKLIATGCSGVLYPPHSISKEFLNTEKIKKYCLNADDIWLKFAELKNDIKVVWTGTNFILPYEIEESQKMSLAASNVNQNKNDFYIKECEKLWKIKL